MTVYNFKQQLAYAEALEEEDFWAKAYQGLFPNYVTCVSLPGDTESQRRGKDRLVHLGNGRTLALDEKKRKTVYWQKDGRPCGEGVGELDFCLEYISVDTTGAIGWIEKDLDIDFIAYAWMPLGRVELLPWWPLRSAWIKHKEEWKSIYPRSEAPNEGYMTIGVCVPRRAVWLGIAEACQIIVPQYAQKTKHA